MTKIAEKTVKKTYLIEEVVYENAAQFSHSLNMMASDGFEVLQVISTESYGDSKTISMSRVLVKKRDNALSQAERLEAQEEQIYIIIGEYGDRLPEDVVKSLRMDAGKLRDKGWELLGTHEG